MCIYIHIGKPDRSLTEEQADSYVKRVSVDELEKAIKGCIKPGSGVSPVLQGALQCSVSDPHFFADPDPDTGGKGKKGFFFF